MSLDAQLSSAYPRAFGALIAASVLAVAGCAQLPRLGSAPTMKPVAQLATSTSFSGGSAAWPGEGWWRAYGDPELDTLIDEALRDAPDLKVAQARVSAAAGAVQSAGAARIPEVTGSAVFGEAKQSYDFLIPRQAVPQGWNGYGLASLNFSWEIDFWGKNRAALAAAISEERAAEVEVAQARLILSSSIASSYADLVQLYTLRDNAAETLRLRQLTVAQFRRRHEFGLETLASLRQVEARQASAEGDVHSIDERIGLERNALAALVGAGPDRGLAIPRPTVDVASSRGLPPNLALDLLGRRPDIIASRLRTEAAARRIDESKAGFYPSVNLLALGGLGSIGISNLTKSASQMGGVGPAISLPIFNTERLKGQLRGARAEYDASVAIYDATLTNALREVADATTSRKALDAELSSARAAVAAASEADESVSKRYQGSLATYLDVLTADDELVSARRAEAELETRAFSLDVALVRALGGGFTADPVLAQTSNR